MGKSAPTPPDPKETSAAQTGTSVSTAIANAMMGNVNQITPDGSLTYDQTGSYKFTDPYTGHSYDVPTFTATQQLSPEQQAIQDQTRSAQGNLASIANDRSSFLKDHLGKSVNTSGVPSLATSAGQQTGLAGYKQQFSGDIGGGYNTAFNRNIGGAYNERLGPGYQTSVDLTKTYAGADDFSADRQKYEDALWQRGSGDRAQADEALRTKLLNSGLREGSSAWNAEMERQARQNTDARLATFLAGGDEQARMVNLARDAAIFGNQSTLAQAQFGNDALSNQFTLQNNAALNRANFAADQQGRQNAASLAQAQFGREGQQLGNAASLAAAQFSNDANLRNAQFNNAARAQGMQEAYADRSQPINEIIGLMSGSQVQQPNFVNAQQPNIPTTDNAGLINTNYNQRLQAWQANQGILGGIMGGIGSLIGLSDDDAKKDKKRLGDVEGEMGLWEFRYKDEPKSQAKHIGLMASEVEKVKPGAVKRGKDGLRRVDYGKALGLMGARQ